MRRAWPAGRIRKLDWIFPSIVHQFGYRLHRSDGMTSYHQQVAFVRRFDVVEPDGFYIIEDLEYQPPYETELPAVLKTHQSRTTRRITTGARSSAPSVGIRNLIKKYALACAGPKYDIMADR
jgi:hypothetical protein